MALGVVSGSKFGRILDQAIRVLGVGGIAAFSWFMTGQSGASALLAIATGLGCGAIAAIILWAPQFFPFLYGGSAGGYDDDFQFADKMTAAPAVDPAVQAVAEAIDVLAEPVVMFDAQDKFVFCNEAYAMLFPNCTAMLNSGVPYDRLIRGQIDAGYIAAAKGDAEAWLTAHMAGRRSLPRSEPFAGPDGRNYQAREYRATNGGRVTIYTEAAAAGGQGVDDDSSPEITQLKVMLQSQVEALSEAERKLDAAEDEVAEARRAAAEASAASAGGPTTSTEALRAPLNGIIGYADILQSEIYGELGDARYREYAEQITANAQEMLAVVGDGEVGGAGPALAPDPPAPTRSAGPDPEAIAEAQLDAAALASQIRDMMATPDDGAPAEQEPAAERPVPAPRRRAAASGEEQSVMDQWKKLTGGDG